MSKQISRRSLSFGAVGVASAAAVLAAGCSQQQGDDVTKKIGEIITQIQKGVKDACSAVGVLVPTANSVLAVIAALVGSTNPAVITAAIVTQVIDSITKQACAADAPPTPQSGRRRTVNVKISQTNIPVEFY